jgi:hypothetical protein
MSTVRAVVCLLAACASRAAASAGPHITHSLQAIHPHLITAALGKPNYFVTPSATVVTDKQTISVSFSTLTPAAGDWVGLYSPSTANVSTTVPVKWVWLGPGCTPIWNVCSPGYPNYIATGAGSVEMELINMRADYILYFFTGGLAAPVAVAQSAVITLRDYNQPLRARLLPTSDPDTVRVRWTSNSGPASAPVLLVSAAGAGGPFFPGSFPVTSDRLAKGDMCGAPATAEGWRDMGWSHTGVISGVQSGGLRSRTFYRYGDNVSGLSPVYSFAAPPPTGGAGAYPTRLIAFGDLGRGGRDYENFEVNTWDAYGQAAYNTSRCIERELGVTDAIFHIGDISYATGYMAVWDWWLAMMEPITSAILYSVTLGNHESDWPNSASLWNVTDSGGECGAATTHVMPLPEPASTNAPWYSWNVGPFHLIGLSSEHDFRRGSPQWNWLRADLRSLDRAALPCERPSSSPHTLQPCPPPPLTPPPSTSSRHPLPSQAHVH